MQDQTIITCENTSNTHTHTAPDHRQTQTNICNHTDVNTISAIHFYVSIRVEHVQIYVTTNVKHARIYVTTNVEHVMTNANTYVKKCEHKCGYMQG